MPAAPTPARVSDWRRTCRLRDVPAKARSQLADNRSRAQSSRRRSRVPTSSSTRTTRSTGTRGATRPSTRARSEDKPIFLSIGYSTCHWCHVMEHESFENAEVADGAQPALRVDQGRSRGAARRRSRLHDVRAGDDRLGRLADERVADAVAAAVLRRHLLPADVAMGQAGLRRHARRRSRASGATSATRSRSPPPTIVERLRSVRRAGAAAGPCRRRPCSSAPTAEFAAAFDARRGGFGDAPKFPRPSELLFLLREHARTGERRAARHGRSSTLRAMALGGMRDHLGGGFHRYSVDGDWRVPHFEKMLYDQAQLVLAYARGGAGHRRRVLSPTWRSTRSTTCARDLTDADGGFYSAEDADSVPPEQAGDPDAAQDGGRVLHLARRRDPRACSARMPTSSACATACCPTATRRSIRRRSSRTRTCSTRRGRSRRSRRETGRSRRGRRGRAGSARRRRCSRVRDDAAAAAPRRQGPDRLERPDDRRVRPRRARARRRGRGYLAAARARGARSSAAQLWDAATGTLLRRYRQGDAGVDGYAEDYAYLIFGLLELFQADGDPAVARVGARAAASGRTRCSGIRWTAAGSARPGTDPSVLLRLKEDYDGAEPAASSVRVLNLLTLCASHGRARVMAEQRSSADAGRIRRRVPAQMGRAVPMMLAALSTYHSGMPQVVLVGDERRRHAHCWRSRASDIMPTAVTVPVASILRGREALARLLPWTAAMTMRDGQATAYLCRDFACRRADRRPRREALMR